MSLKFSYLHADSKAYFTFLTITFFYQSGENICSQPMRPCVRTFERHYGARKRRTRILVKIVPTLKAAYSYPLQSYGQKSNLSPSKPPPV